MTFAYFNPLNLFPGIVVLDMEECESVVLLQHVLLPSSHCAALVGFCGYVSIYPVLTLAVGSTLFV